MDREKLRQQSSSRRNHVEEINTSDGKWLCTYCKHPFHSEKVFMNHRCKEREKLDELTGFTGQSAYACYAAWMKAKKRSVPPIETFASSMYYATFIKFAKHAHKINIPNINQFINVMVENGDITPTLWCRDNVYSMYLTWYDTIYSPETQFIDSLEYIELLMEDYEVGPDKIFSTIDIDKLVLNIKKRKLSPWFLLASKRFRDFTQELKSDDKALVESSLNTGAMLIQIKKKQDLFKLFNLATQEKNL